MHIAAMERAYRTQPFCITILFSPSWRDFSFVHGYEKLAAIRRQHHAPQFSRKSGGILHSILDKGNSDSCS
jgi:hypothetical protein